MNRQTLMSVVLVVFLVIGFYSASFDGIDNTNRALAATSTLDKGPKSVTFNGEIKNAETNEVVGSITFILSEADTSIRDVVIKTKVVDPLDCFAGSKHLDKGSVAMKGGEITQTSEGPFIIKDAKVVGKDKYLEIDGSFKPSNHATGTVILTIELSGPISQIYGKPVTCRMLPLLWEAYPKSPVASAPIKVNTVCIWGKKTMQILGEILYLNLSPNPRYPNVVIVRESSPKSERLSLKVGAAYLSKEPDKYEFLQDVDLSLTDEALAERFGVSLRK